MPGYAFHLETLKQVSAKLAGSDPATAGLLQSPYAALGAFGPDLLMYTPPSQQLAGDLGTGRLAQLIADLGSISNPPTAAQQAELKELMELFQKPVGSAYSALFSTLVGPSWPQISTVISFVAQANTIANNEDESALGGFFSQLPAVQTALTSLGTSLPNGIKELVGILAALIGLGPWMETVPAGVGAALLIPAANPKACRTYEFLRWHKSGQFATALLDGATTDNQRAFALGWLSHVAGSVTGEPFVNNIVGGPYRTHWWRNRMVQNFVDAWTWGRYETQNPSASMSGDTPTPSYDKWAPLFGANLQNAFNVGNLPGPAATGQLPTAVTAMGTGDVTALAASFPPEITDLIAKAITSTYPPTPLLPPPEALSADEFASAYVGAYAVFWFLTAGDGPLGNNATGPPPSNCGTTPPSWTTSSGSSQPPQQQGVTSGSEACEIILAILAVLAFLTGNAAAGIALLVAALEEQPSIDWDKVRCDVFWVTFTVDKIENLLRDALVMSTLAYPPPILLGGPDTSGNTQPATDFTNTTAGQDPAQPFPGNAPPSGGVPLTRTNNMTVEQGTFPKGLDKTNTLADLNWLRYPEKVPVETDAAENQIPGGKYPEFVMDGSGLAGAGMMNPGAFPTRAAFFGDAVANAAKLIEARGKGLADYNLDGDRGYGWLGWRPKPLTNPQTPPVQVQQD